MTVFEKNGTYSKIVGNAILVFLDGVYFCNNDIFVIFLFHSVKNYSRLYFGMPYT